MKKRTPQEKKLLSYEKDRRNRFGQNDKAARKLIPTHKAKSRRRYRHAAAAIARQAVADVDDRSQIQAEARTALVDKRRWQKCPDVALKEAIQGKKEWRVMRYGRKKGKGTPGGGLPGYSVNAKLNSVDHEGILKRKKRPIKAVDPSRVSRPAVGKASED
jgi:hypothetical protein